MSYNEEVGQEIFSILATEVQGITQKKSIAQEVFQYTQQDLQWIKEGGSELHLSWDLLIEKLVCSSWTIWDTPQDVLSFP